MYPFLVEAADWHGYTRIKNIFTRPIRVLLRESAAKIQESGYYKKEKYMKLKWIVVTYVMFLLILSVSLDFELVPKPRALVKKFAPSISRNLPHRIPYDDKIAHFFLAGALSFFVNLNLGLSQVSIGKLKILKGSLLLFVFITIEECSQSLFPSRSFSLSDLFSNYAGVLCFGRAAIALMNNRAVIEPKLPQFVATLIWTPERE
jgi:VanZ family protein